MSTFKEKLEQNIWEENLDEVIRVIKEQSHPDSEWCWAYNARCKYVSLRIDMRDGGFILLDRYNKRISLDDLKWQISGAETLPASSRSYFSH